jgi:hypothetical protein
MLVVVLLLTVLIVTSLFILIDAFDRVVVDDYDE